MPLSELPVDLVRAGYQAGIAAGLGEDYQRAPLAEVSDRVIAGSVPVRVYRPDTGTGPGTGTAPGTGTGPGTDAGPGTDTGSGTGTGPGRPAAVAFAHARRLGDRRPGDP